MVGPELLVELRRDAGRSLRGQLEERLREAVRSRRLAPAAAADSSLRFDFFPGYPDLGAFPRGAWLRAMRETLAQAPPRRLGYPDAAGTQELREALAEHLPRVRGVVADPQRIVVCS